MFSAAAFALLGLVLAVPGRSALRAGRWRRPADDKAIPSFTWLFVAAPVVFGLTGRQVGQLSWWVAPAYLLLAGVGLLLAAVDSDVHRLPDKLTLPALPAVAAGLTLASAGTAQWTRMLWALVGCVAVGGAFLLLALAAPSGLGLGDVKLSALLGLALGWLGATAVLAWLFYGFLLGGLWALALLVTRRVSRHSHVAFGPPLLLGALLALLGTQSL